jgi:hypothetical protein
VKKPILLRQHSKGYYLIQGKQYQFPCLEIYALCHNEFQPFIEGEQADLENIKELLTFNGFKNTRRQDYYNKELGLELEDMHDENVIAKDDLLFFIDTVFYIMERK